MKLFKGNYGWSTTAHSKSKEGKDVKCYMDVQFARKSDPPVDELEGKLIFTSRGGLEYECFFSSYENKGGLIVPKLVMMPLGETKTEQKPLIGNDNRDMFGRNQDVTIDPEELPFY